MNNVILLGRFTRDPELRYSQEDNSLAITRFTLAVERRVKKAGSEEADFIGCVSFGKTAEFIHKYFTSGKKIVIRGRIQTSSYTNKEGAKVYSTVVVVEDAEFAESKSSNASADLPPVDSDGYMNIPEGIDEGLPFN